MPNGIMSAMQAAGGAVPTSAAARRAEELGERFLTLLVAQMQNQTPLNPMDSAQVTSQIAQINMVSGINNLNTTLSSITDQIDTTQRLQATELIGHRILVPGNKIKVGADGAATPFGIELARPASTVEISVLNHLGEVVWTDTLTGVRAGIHSYEWPGVDATGAPAQDPTYTLAIKAVGPDGSSVPLRPLTMGLVSGVVASENGPLLDLGPNLGMATLEQVRQIIS